MSQDEGFYVEVVEWLTESGEKVDKVAKRLGPFLTERQADKCDDGVNINLNHVRFFTRIIWPKKK